jgi:uncharacterized protein (TIGR01777 family)
MKVFITGGLGFVGRHLCRRLLEKGHAVTATGTRPHPEPIDHPLWRYLQADTRRPGPWQQDAAACHAAVNLAGRTIFKRWSPAYKKQIVDSRILTTRYLVEALAGSATLISTSAVGFYGDRGEDLLAEDQPAGRGFLAEVAAQWEAEAFAAKQVRVVVARFGVVLGSGGGALEKMVPAFKAFIGGALGSGRQWMPWIHMADLLGAIEFALENDGLDGPLNFCAPEPVRNRDVAAALGRVLGRPAAVAVPEFVLRLAMGEMADTILASLRGVPQRLAKAGYGFQFVSIDQALADLVGAK